jgi:hypothetical protein
MSEIIPSDEPDVDEAEDKFLEEWDNEESEIIEE